MEVPAPDPFSPDDERNKFLKPVVEAMGFLELDGVMIRPAVFHQLTVTEARPQGWHVHPFWELTWVRQGKNVYRERKGDRVLPRKTGEIFFMPAGLEHNWHAEKCPMVLDGFMLELFPITTPAAAALDAMRQKIQGDGFSAPAGLGQGFLLAVDREVAARGRYVEKRLSLLITDFFIELFRLVLPATKNISPKPPSSQARLFLLAREWIDRHLEEDPSLTAVGQALEITPRTLNRIFGQILGMPCGKYIQERKLVQGYHLLQTRPMVRVREVARLSGFDDPAYFTRAFATRFGFSPTEMRERFMH